MWGIYIAFGVVMHFCMDAIWTDPVTFYWPLYGAFQTHAGISTWILQSWIESFLVESRLYVSEATGFLILLFFITRLIIQRSVTAFMLQGRL